MMRNIYAGALFHTGHKKEAFDIYAEQGDQTSIRWAMRKYRNLAGIQTIFEENPNAPTLYYLVQKTQMDRYGGSSATLDGRGRTLRGIC